MPIDHDALREGGEILTFEELPLEAQMALAHYMSLDGEAWELPPDFEMALEKILRRYSFGSPKSRPLIVAALRDAIPDYIAEYGDFEIGYHPCIPTEKLVDAVMTQVDEDPTIEPIDWEQHWQEPPKANIERHDLTKPLWPVILSGFPDEALQDGWKRFGYYVWMGVPCIPALFYV